MKTKVNHLLNSLQERYLTVSKSFRKRQVDNKIQKESFKNFHNVKPKGVPNNMHNLHIMATIKSNVQKAFQQSQ